MFKFSIGDSLVAWIGLFFCVTVIPLLLSLLIDGKKGWRVFWNELPYGWITKGLLVVMILQLPLGLISNYTASNPPCLTGHVLGRDGSPIPEVTVSLISERIGDLPTASTFQFHSGAETDENGVYSLPLDNVSRGGYEVIIWDDLHYPVQVQPVTLGQTFLGQIEGPTFTVEGK